MNKKLTLNEAGKRGLDVFKHVYMLKNSGDKDKTSFAIAELRRIYQMLTGRAYSSLRGMAKSVDVAELEFRAKDLSMKLALMPLNEKPSVNDISNPKVKEAIARIANDKDFKYEHTSYLPPNSVGGKIPFKDWNKIIEILTKFGKKIFFEAVMNGSKIDFLGQLTLRRGENRDKLFEEVMLEIEGNGIDLSVIDERHTDQIRMIIRRELEDITNRIGGLVKQIVTNEIDAEHKYDGERETFVKNLCEQLLSSKSMRSEQVAERLSLFSKTDKRGKTTDVKTLGGMPVKKMKESISRCADLFGGHVPAIRFENFSSRGKATERNGELLISVGSNTEESTIWHEMAHHVEASLPWISSLTTGYLIKKYEGSSESVSHKKILGLREITGNDEYERDEFAIINPSAPNPYVLKLYLEKIPVNETYAEVVSQIRALEYTEVLSMGMTYLGNGTLHKYAHDTDFISTVITIIKKLQEDGE